MIHANTYAGVKYFAGRFVYSDRLLSYLADTVLRMRRKNRGTVPTQVWHVKDPSMLKGPKCQT
jgi:hypothetical protein